MKRWMDSTFLLFLALPFGEKTDFFKAEGFFFLSPFENMHLFQHRNVEQRGRSQIELVSYTFNMSKYGQSGLHSFSKYTNITSLSRNRSLE